MRRYGAARRPHPVGGVHDDCSIALEIVDPAVTRDAADRDFRRHPRSYIGARAVFVSAPGSGMGFLGSVPWVRGGGLNCSFEGAIWEDILTFFVGRMMVGSFFFPSFDKPK